MQSDSFVEREVLPLLKSVLEKLLTLSKTDLKFDKDNPQQLYSICLYCTVLSLAQSCKLLIENRTFIALPILLRSLMEAHADLLNVMKNPAYPVKIMYLSYLCEKKRLLENVKNNPDSPFFKFVVSSGADEKLKEVEKEIDSVKGRCKKNKNLSTWKRFSKADLKNKFQSVYWRLCLETHNNIYALEKRHIKKTDGSYEVFLEKDESLDNWLRYIDGLIGILIDSSLQIHSFLETTAEGHLNELKVRHDELRKRYPKSETGTAWQVVEIPASK